MNRRPTPETDNNEYAHTFLEQYGYESSLQDAPVDWADFARRLERERDAERALADRLADAIEAIWPFIEEDIPHGCNSTGYMNAIELCGSKLAAWKEARND